MGDTECDAREWATATLSAVERLGHGGDIAALCRGILQLAAERDEHAHAIEETERRIGKIERLIADATPQAIEARFYVDGLETALRILRGDP